MQGICVLLWQPFINDAVYDRFSLNMRFRFLIPILVFFHTAFAAVNTTPQQNVDLRQYAGRWYEQARYENWFEKDMDEVYTDYMLHKDGTLTVQNNGRTIKGKAKQSVGRAFPSEPGEMQVSFVWPYWWFRAPYKILYVNKDYSAALVAGEGDEYLWMLTRDRFPGDETMDKLRAEAQRRGFDTDKLRYTMHQKRKSTAPDTKKPG